MRSGRAWLLACVSLLLAPGLWLQVAAAQDADPPAQAQPAPPAEPEPVEDAFNRVTPQSMARALLLALESGDYERAAEYLDLRFRFGHLAQYSGEDLARMINVILQRRLWIDFTALSDDPEGLAGDGLVRTRDELGRIQVDGEEIVLYLERVPRDDGERIWKISRRTVARIPDLYEQFGYAPWVEKVAEFLPEGSLLGVEYFKWAISLAALVVSFLALFLLGWLLARILMKRSAPLYPRVRHFFRGPIATLGALVIAGAILLDLGVGVTGQRFARAHTLITIALIWLLFSFIGLTIEFFRRRFIARDREAAVVLLRPVANALKILIFLAGALFWLDNIGFDISTLLAGLGIGGLAVALALQRPLEDMFGALTLFSLQVVRVGDFCKFGAELGTIEEIGLRITRIRTLADTVLTVPNSRFAQEYINNYSERRKIRYIQTIQLRVDTTREQLDQILENVRAALEEHEQILEGTPRVRFKELALEGFTIEAHAYIDTQLHATYLEVTEAINLRIVSIVQDAGAHFAVPIETDAGRHA